MAKTTSNPKGAGRPVLEEKKVRTGLLINENVMRSVKYIAFSDSTSMTDIINDALENYIKKWVDKNGPIPKK